MVAERPPGTELTEIWLDGKPYMVQGSVNWEYTNLFGRKTNQGDPGPDDHPTLSTSIQTDWSGGALVNRGNPASDMNRFYWSTSETQYPGALSLPPYTFEFDAPAGETSTPWIIGDYQERLHVAWGMNLYKYDQILGTWTPVTGLTGSPVSQGEVYREASDTSPHGQYLFIPTSNGYHTLDTTGSITVGTDTDPVIEFRVWDDKIFKLMGDGTLWYATKLPVLPADWVFSAAIPDGGRPRRLVRFKNMQNEPTLFVVTDGSTWKHDFANSMMHADDLEFPRHPEQGRAAINHKGNAYISVGTGVFRYDNNTISPMGLDSRDGLPQDFRGMIVDFESTYNGLYALVQGQTMAGTTIPNTGDLYTGPGDLTMYGDAAKTNNLVMIHNGFGWHYRWHGQGSSPNNIYASNTQDMYTIWWGAAGKLYMQIMPRTYFNPADLDTRGYPVALSSIHETSWNAWNWLGQDKILKSIELGVERMTPGQSIEVQYKLDSEDNDWVSVGEITEEGEYRYYVGLDTDEPTLKGGVMHYRGERHERYKLRFILTRDPDVMDSSPVIAWHSVIARRWLRPQRTWRLSLSMTQKVKDWTIEQQREHLELLGTKQRAVVFEHGEHKYMVEVVYASGPESTGRDWSRLANLTLMEANDLGPLGEL